MRREPMKRLPAQPARGSISSTSSRAMAELIIFRCPQTGMDVQTLLDKQEKDEARIYESVICPACTRLHFINKSTSKALGQDK